MNAGLKWIGNKMPKTDASKELALMAPGEIEKVRKFHSSFPQYSRTPLAALDNLASHLGVGGIYVKDESYRFGLNAFKVLGGSYAMAKFISQRTKRDIGDLGYAQLTSPKVKQELGDYTFFTSGLVSWSKPSCEMSRPTRLAMKRAMAKEPPSTLKAFRPKR